MSLHVSPAHVSSRRSLAKTVTWRIIGSLDTFAIGFVATGEARVGLVIAGTEVITKMALYYFHERGWAHVKWGIVKQKSENPDIPKDNLRKPGALNLTATNPSN